MRQLCGVMGALCFLNHPPYQISEYAAGYRFGPKLGVNPISIFILEASFTQQLRGELQSSIFFPDI